MFTNPIATLLGIAPAADKRALHIGATDFELYPANGDTVETMYRVNPGHGVSNPGFSLHLTSATHHAMTLGGYLAGRQGVKRGEAEAAVAAARIALAA
jgi:hypothetical protein